MGGYHTKKEQKLWHAHDTLQPATREGYIKTATMLLDCCLGLPPLHVIHRTKSWQIPS